MPTGLKRRGARYVIRRVIPKDLQDHYGCREKVVALGTADPVEARILHAKAWVAFDEEFAGVRAQLTGEPHQFNDTQEPADIAGTISD